MRRIFISTVIIFLGIFVGVQDAKNSYDPWGWPAPSQRNLWRPGYYPRPSWYPSPSEPIWHSEEGAMAQKQSSLPTGPSQTKGPPSGAGYELVGDSVWVLDRTEEQPREEVAVAGASENLRTRETRTVENLDFSDRSPCPSSSIPSLPRQELQTPSFSRSQADVAYEWGSSNTTTWIDREIRPWWQPTGWEAIFPQTNYPQMDTSYWIPHLHWFFHVAPNGSLSYSSVWPDVISVGSSYSFTYPFENVTVCYHPSGVEIYVPMMPDLFQTVCWPAVFPISGYYPEMPVPQWLCR